MTQNQEEYINNNSVIRQFITHTLKKPVSLTTIAHLIDKRIFDLKPQVECLVGELGPSIEKRIINNTSVINRMRKYKLVKQLEDLIQIANDYNLKYSFGSTLADEN